MTARVKIGLMLGTGTYEANFKGRLGNTEASGTEPMFEISSLLFPAKTAAVWALACSQLVEDDRRRDARIKRT
jgi:hypothetical protein